MSGLRELLDGLSDEQCTGFARQFLREYTEQGFGALTKRDTELLLFCCLQRSLGGAAPRTNYEWARLLRITPARVRNLRRDAYIRFDQLLTAEQGDALVRHAIAQVQSLDILPRDERGGTVRLVADDPVIELELEPRLDRVGSYQTSERNARVLCIPLTGFLALLDELLGAEADAAYGALLKRVLADEGERGKLERELAKAKWAGKSEMGKLRAFLELLATTYAPKQKKLLEMLETIFGSQGHG